MSEGKSKSFLMGAALGTLAGAAAALFYAPQKGDKTRQLFKKKASQAKKKLLVIQSEIEKQGGALEVTEKAMNNLVESLTQSAQTLSQQTQKNQAEKVIESTKKPEAASSPKKKPRLFRGI